MKKVVIVDDHRLFSDGIQFMLSHATEYVVTGVVHQGQEVLPLLAQQPADVLLLDIDLPDISGFELAKAVRHRYPTLSILALSMLDDTHSIERILQAGATGYCIKSAGYDELLAALHCVSAGETYLPATYLHQCQSRQYGLDRTGLTEREAEIIRLIAEGVSTKQIALQLCLSTRTVETHRKNIYRKLDVHTNVELAQVARQHRLL